MSLLLPLIAATCVWGSGFPIACLLRRSKSRFDLAIDALLCGALLVSAIFWIPWLHALPLSGWLLVIEVLTVAGVVLAVALFRNARITRMPVHSWMTVAVICALGIVALVRAQIDWDAITYFLFAGLGFATSDHVGWTLPTTIVVTPGVPNLFPPVLPVIYGLCIELASRFHGTADQAVRLIPLMFLVGSTMATFRLGTRFMRPWHAGIAALLFASLPGVIFFMTSQALSVDMAATFAFIYLLCELTAKDVGTAGALRIGLAISLGILVKVTGPESVAFALTPFVLGFLSARIGQILIGGVLAAVVAFSWKLHLLEPFLTLQFAIALALCCVAAVSATARREGSRIDARAVGISTIACLPGLWYLFQLTRLDGSPLGLYVQQFAHVDAPNWDWAFRTLAAAKLFDHQMTAGLPHNYGYAMFLWWGYGPAVAAAAIAGVILALRRAHPIRFLVLPLCLYLVAFMTVFGFEDFRRLLPIFPLIGIMATYGIASTVRNGSRVPVIAIFLIALDLPFAWIAQQTIFKAPDAFLNSLALDQYHAFSSSGLVVAFALTTVGVALGALVWAVFFPDALRRVLMPIWTRSSLLSALVILLASDILMFYATGPTVAIGLVVALTMLIGVFWLLSLSTADDLWNRIRARDLVRYGAFSVLIVSALLGIGNLAWESLCASAIVLALMLNVMRPGSAPSRAVAIPVILGLVLGTFAPVGGTILSGASTFAASVFKNQYYGYVPALSSLDMGGERRRVLAFLNYGIPWLTVGRFQRLDIADAFDLAYAKGTLQATNPRDFLNGLESLGIDAAILPSSTNVLEPEYTRLIRGANLGVLETLDQPAIANEETVGNWNVYDVLPTSKLPLHIRAALTMLDSTSRVIPVTGIATPAGRQVRSLTITGLSRSNPMGALYWESRGALHTQVVRGRDGRIDVVLNKALPSVGQANLRAIVVDDGAYRYSWRAFRAGLSLDDEGNFILGRGALFSLTPAEAPISRIGLVDASGANGIELYPAIAQMGIPSTWEPNLQGQGFLDITSSGACAEGSARASVLGGTVGEGSRWYQAVQHPSTSNRWRFNLSRLNAYNLVQIQRVQVTCSVGQVMRKIVVDIEPLKILREGGQLTLVNAVVQPTVIESR